MEIIKKKQKMKGITLIALVITIIVLLILAGISISMLSGENSILNQAGNARDETEEKSIAEKVQLAYAGALANGQGKVTEPLMTAELNKYFSNYDLDLNNEKVKIDGNDYGFDGTVMHGDDSGTKDKKGKSIATTSETTPFLPNPSKNEITNNILSTGLTIKDENNNEWVWIEVPKTATVYKTAGVGQTLPAVPDNSENSIYKKIEADLRKYCETGKDGNALITQTDGTESTKSQNTTTAGYVDEYVAGKGTNITSAAIYKEYKQKMLKSVYENGGFYIGKYETGFEGENKRGEAGATTQKAVIKPNAYPYNYVTNAQAEDLSEGLATGGKTTTLLFGVQWDLVLRHLSEHGVSTNDLTSNCSGWGNYYNQPFTINRGEYSVAGPWNNFIPYTTTTENKVTVTGSGENQVSQKLGTTLSDCILLTTGASDNNSKKNIYDFAGSVFEWTLEKSSYYDYPCTDRGGNFTRTGYEYPASNRGYNNTSKSSSSIRFPCCTLLI